MGKDKKTNNTRIQKQKVKENKKVEKKKDTGRSGE